MSDRRIRSLAIVGGGTAGWMAAAALSKALAGLGVRLRLIESPRIEPIGVGEATIPPIMDFIRQLGIDEDDLVREIKATYKLGIGYRDWTRAGHFYFHPFGPIGPGIGDIPFQAYWLKMLLEGSAGRLEEYSIQAAAALRGRFARPVHAAQYTAQQDHLRPALRCRALCALSARLCRSARRAAHRRRRSGWPRCGVRTALSNH